MTSFRGWQSGGGQERDKARGDGSSEGRLAVGEEGPGPARGARLLGPGSPSSWRGQTKAGSGGALLVCRKGGKRLIVAFGEMGSGRTNLLLRHDKIRAGKQEELAEHNTHV